MGGVAPILASLAGSVANSLFSPLPYQAKNSFDQSPGIDPGSMLHSFTGMLDSVAPLFQQRANAPVSLPDAVVQGLPTFTGGGLPFPIGAGTGTPSSSPVGKANSFNPNTGSFFSGEASSSFPLGGTRSYQRDSSGTAQNATDPATDTPLPVSNTEMPPRKLTLPLQTFDSTGSSGAPSSGGTAAVRRAFSSGLTGNASSSGNDSGNNNSNMDPVSAALQLLYHVAGNGQTPAFG